MILLVFGLLRQLLQVDFGYGVRVSSFKAFIRAGELFEGLQVLVSQGVGADGTEWGGGPRSRCEELKSTG